MVKKKENLNKGEIVIYKDKSNKVDLDVRLEKETVWLSQQQMAILFGKNVRTINEHINNIFKEKELDKNSVIRKFRITASDGKKYNTNFYNLDIIISVGYRVKSVRGTQFRIWATKKLKEIIVKGYVVNQKRLKEGNIKNLKDLDQVISLTKRLIEAKQLDEKETEGVLRVVTDYANSWVLLQKYDEGSLLIPKKKVKVKNNINYDFAIQSIAQLKSDLLKKKEAGDLFGKQRNEMLQGILGNLCQSFGGNEIYPSIEERAAHLLYFIIKDHPFFDGNKRIASFLFILFLRKNNYFYNKKGKEKINDIGLVALALFIAQSDSKEKEGIIKLIINFLNS
ncbi:MAG: virulence protein RhuM/Fic/DOC family protein [Candidatus Pacebacteria bacterium]|nr:virulence protein RhuM/Fic/DOC family protein [Candidatus Paceibacterota bacterium]MDD5012805.1 virulence protein RhuM/Fic/DOC family protein [Candidatus Paceibacterota bacterium]MDD5752545.1 virulence protein RhuM/Fic/DOC family protein [Candidatus Paceibacterota bacterium]